MIGETSVLFVLTQKGPKKSRTDDIQPIRSSALIKLCAVDFAHGLIIF